MTILNKYLYLEKYIENIESIRPGNYFDKVQNAEIKKAESCINYSLPQQLKELWLEIDCGIFD